MTTIAPPLPTITAVRHADLARAVRIAIAGLSGAAPSRLTLLISSRADGLAVTSSDFDTTTTIRLPGLGGTEVDIHANAQQLRRALINIGKTCPRKVAADVPVTLETRDGRVWLSWGTDESVAIDRGTPVVDNPLTFDPAGLTTVDRHALMAAWARVAPAAGTDPLLPVFMDVHLANAANRIALTATDRYQIAQAFVDDDAYLADPILLPAKRIHKIAKLLTGDHVSLGTRRMRAMFICDDVIVDYVDRGRTFPNLDRLMAMPDPAVTWHFDTEMVLHMAKAAAALNPEYVTLRHNGNDLAVINDAGEDVASVPSEATGPTDLTIHLNPAYLTKGLDAIGPGQASLSIRKPAAPVLLQHDNNPTRYTIMAMRPPTH